MQTFRACERRYKFRYEMGLELDRDSRSLRFGKRFHQGLDLIFTGGDLDFALREIAQSYCDVPEWANAEEWAVERETCIALLAGWFYRWHSDPDARLGCVASELSFELPVINPGTGRKSRGWRRAGKIDRIVSENRDGVPWSFVMEHKTTSESLEAGSDYLLRLRIDPQISLYFLAARELGYFVDGILYDIIRKPSIRPKAPTKADLARLYSDGTYFGVELTKEEMEKVSVERETPAMYGARLVADIVSRSDFYFSRLPVARLDADLRSAEADVWLTQQRITQDRRVGAWLSNPSACLLPYRCAFADLCFAGVRPETLAPGEIPQGYRIETAHSELESQ
jgi:hypothetical protein